MSVNQNLILIEGAATYERILMAVRDVETEEGVRHILDFLKIYPEFAQAHNDAAVLFHRTGNSLKALAHYEKAHKLDPANVTYRKNLADFYYVELEWTGEAIHTYLDILKDNPFDREALNTLGTISLNLGRREQARQYFTRTLQLEATDMTARAGLQQIDPEAAVLQLPAEPAARSSAPPPVQPPAAPQTAPRQESAQSTSQPARSVEELYRDALTQAEAGNNAAAIDLLEIILTQNPTLAPVHNDMGVLCQRDGQLQRSRQHHEEAARLQPDNNVFHKNLADLLAFEFGDQEAALAIYVKLLSVSQYDVELLMAITHICLQVGRRDDAVYFLNQVIAIKPWDQEALALIREIGAPGSGSDVK